MPLLSSFYPRTLGLPRNVSVAELGAATATATTFPFRCVTGEGESLWRKQRDRGRRTLLHRATSYYPRDWSNVGKYWFGQDLCLYPGCTCNQDLILSFAGLFPLDTRAVPSTQSSTWTYISTHLSQGSRPRSPASLGLKKSPVVI